jgi:hypothetical protein
LDPTFLALTLDPAPSSPSTIYVTGFVFTTDDGGTVFETQGILLKTSDDGQTWQRNDIPNTSNQRQPFLSAVDPNDPNKLYIRVQGPDITGGSSGFVENSLLYSDDGGSTHRELLSAQADFLGFALAPDGETVFIGMGDSRAPGAVRPGDEKAFGLYRAAAPALSCQRIGHMGGVPVGHIGCLTFDGEELWLCTSEFKQGFELARSSDRGVTLQSVMHLSDLKGPVQCGCSTSTGEFCPAAWQAVCENIGRCEFGVKDPVACGEPVASGGASGTGGTTGSSGGNSGGSADTGDSSSSCGLRAPSASSLGSGALAVLMAAAGSLLVFARRRRH